LQEEATATTPILGAKRINQEPINEVFHLSFLDRECSVSTAASPFGQEK
jgi:hypothetical protein